LITANEYTFKILRYDMREPDIQPHFKSYRIKVVSGLTVLMTLLRIRDEIDGTLSFRSSCRSAVCGSCAMVINGKIDLACRSQVASFGENTIVLEPLPNLEIIKDLVVDMTPFWSMYEKVKPYLVRKNPEPEKEIPQGENERKCIDQYVNCILCASCYGACPVLSRNPDYAGPAALAKLERFVIDSRDERPLHSLEGINNENGVWGCNLALRCIDACPKDVRPSDSIVGLRKKLLKYKAKKIFGMIKDED
jgi:succinate dehydrogenase / fumarate reductase, iron-sulfur subunit